MEKLLIKKLKRNKKNSLSSIREVINWIEINKNHLQDQPFWLSTHFCPKSEKPLQWIVKRLFDITCASLGLIAILPFLAIVAIAIKLESKGPALFKQKRVGRFGKEFYMYKFRSMDLNAEDRLKDLLKYNETNEGMFKMADDPRVTKVGKFIRKYSIDELPQLINVIKGEMSLIGPRPCLSRELKTYKNWHYVRFATLPGLTGLWQVSGRSSIKDFDKAVSLDYQYINNWNIGLDISILFRTIPAVLFPGKTAS